MKYDAFISYRHTPLDMEIAKKLHRSLETFPIPLAVQKKTGKKKIRRVFRDQEELPIGSNLTDKINAALKETEYLIVVCSPETPGSEWVRKEIETFIEMHDRSHVLAILIDGEPEDSFPPALLTDENGHPVEPLAADIRGTDKKERNHKFKTELLRLAAPVIGCSFDDLRQRHRERLIRKTIAYVTLTALVTGGAGAAFGIYSTKVAKQMESLAQEKGSLANENATLALDFMQENRDKQINQSRFYASKAMSLLSEGYRKQAALVACAALPSDTENRPYVAEAEYALSSALHVYDDGKIRDYYKNLEHELPVSKFWKNYDNSYLITLDQSNNVHVWTVDTWEETVRIAPEILDNYYDDVLIADADAERIYVMTYRYFYVYDAAGALQYCIEAPGSGSLLGSAIDPERGVAFLIDGENIWVIQLSDGSITANYNNEMPGKFNSKVKYDNTTGLLIVGHSTLDGVHAAITFLHTETGDYYNALLTEDDMLQFNTTINGNVAALSCPTDYYALNEMTSMTLDLFSPNGEKLWTQTVDPDIFDMGRFNILIRSHTYPVDDGERSGIVVSAEDKVFTFDEADGRLITEMPLPANAVSMLLGINSASAFIAYTNGDIQLGNMEIGMLYDSNSNMHINYLADLIAINSTFIARAQYDKNIYVLSAQTAPDQETLPQTTPGLFSAGVSPAGDYYILAVTGDSTGYHYYDPDGNEIFQTENHGYTIADSFCDNVFLIASREGVQSVDPITGSDRFLSYEELGIDTNLITKAHFSANGDFCAFSNGAELYVVDMKKECCIFHTKTDETVGTAIPSGDGSTVFISAKSRSLYSTDTATGEIHSYDDRLQEVSDYYGMEYMALSPDARYIAMSCLDQKVWILDTATDTLSGGLPMQINKGSFIRFSEDGHYLFLQGNDYIFRIWDVEKEEYINSFSTNSYIKDIVSDPENHKFALITGYSLYLMDTTQYGLCAYVPDCVAYMTNNNSFIQYVDGTVYRCYYKDYKTLIEETARQFPGAELSNAEKVEYNIN